MINRVYLINAATCTALSGDLTFEWVESVWSTEKGAENHLINDLCANYVDYNYWMNKDDNGKPISYRITERELDKPNESLDLDNLATFTSVEQVLEMMMDSEHYSITKDGSPGNEIYHITNDTYDLEATYYVRNGNWSYSVVGIQDSFSDSKEIDIESLNKLQEFTEELSRYDM